MAVNAVAATVTHGGLIRRGVPVAVVLCLAVGLCPTAHADNKRLNYAVFSSIYTSQKQNGCPTSAHVDDRLLVAAQRHALDMRDHREIDGEIGSDGSTPQDRGRDAGFVGRVSQTIAINPSLAINALDVLNQWWGDPVARATMQNCSNSAVGVWSENSLDRSVVVAVYGQPGMA